MNDRRKTLKKNFFECIDSEIKAYLLGFIGADGSITYEDESNGSQRLQVAVTESDREILEMFREHIYPDSNIGTCGARDNTFKNKTYTSKPWCYFRIHCRKLVEDILNLGIPTKKTYKGFNLPPMSPELYRHFIRGYFDGDGTTTLSVIPRKGSTEIAVNRSFSIISKTPALLLDIQKDFQNNQITTYVGGDGRGNYIIRASAKSSMEKIYSYLYNDSNYCLRRKREKFQEALITSSAAKDLKGYSRM